MSTDVNAAAITKERMNLQDAMRAELAAKMKEIAEKAIGLFTAVAATTKFISYTQYLETDNESRLGLVIGSTGAPGDAGDIVVNIRGLSRGGAFWGDFVNTDGVCDGHNSLTVVELSPFLRLAADLSTALDTAFPSGHVVVLKPDLMT